ncbi:heavy-metal-associated domain-containing protein [Patescibacteria group bacterium]
MFLIFKKNKPKGKAIEFKIEGMHCTSCVMNIDGALEDIEGINSSNSSYRKGKTSVDFDPEVISETKIIQTIKDAGYTASVS